MAINRTAVYRAVIADVRDPRNLGRVRLRVPAVLGRAISAWADYATAPQIPARVGDIVWAQFTGGDTRYPVWRQIVKPADLGKFTDLVTGTATINILDVTGAASFDDPVTINELLDVYGTGVFHGPVYFDDPAVFNGTVRVEGDTTFNNPVNINAGVNFADPIAAPGFTVNGAFQVNGGTDLNGGLDVLGGAVIGGLITANDGIDLPAGNWIKRGAMAGIGWQNGWGSYGAGYQAANVIEYPDRTAGLTGVAGGGAVSGTATAIVMCNLPAAVRPGADHVFLAPAEAGNYVQIVVEDNGNVSNRRASAATGIDWISLSGIRWPMNGFGT